MGLTLHYSGSFRKNASLSEMIEEVKDIATIYKWPYFIYETEFPENPDDPAVKQSVYGIAVTPPECETLSLSFLANRRMSNEVMLQFYGDATTPERQSYLYMLWVKTQFAGAETHKLLVHLLKYLEKKYLENLTVKDEGHYWETGDEQLLEETFRRYSDLLDSTFFALESFPMQPGETFEAYFERVLQHKAKKA